MLRNFNENLMQISLYSAEMLHPLGGQSHNYNSIQDPDIELALAAANRNNCHMAAETVAILCLTTTVASSSALSHSFVHTKKRPEIGPDCSPKGCDLEPNIIYISLKIPSHLSTGNSHSITYDIMLFLDYFLYINHRHSPPSIIYAQAPPVGGPGYQFPMVAVAPQPPYDAPHDFLILAMVTTIICAILNLLSLGFGIPAIILSAMVSLTCSHYSSPP